MSRVWSRRRSHGLIGSIPGSGHRFNLQTFEFIRDDRTGDPLPFGPIAEVMSVTYRDGAGIVQVLLDSDYRLLHSGALYAGNWPAIGSGPEDVIISVKAGYGHARRRRRPGGCDQGSGSSKHAAKPLTGHSLENRETVVAGPLQSKPQWRCRICWRRFVPSEDSDAAQSRKPWSRGHHLPP